MMQENSETLENQLFYIRDWHIFGIDWFKDYKWKGGAQSGINIRKYIIGITDIMYILFHNQFYD